MRESWQRARPALTLDPAQAEALLRPVLPGIRVLALEPTSGGLSNSNIRVRLDGPPDDVLLRLYQREPAQAEKEAALAKLVEGRVPVARVLHLAADNPVTGGPYAVVEWRPGEPVSALPVDAALAAALGRTLAAIHSFTFPHHGFFAPDLSVPEPMDLGQSGHLFYLRRFLMEGVGAARVGPALGEAVLTLVERAGGCLDDWLEPPCLTHADFNPTNVLARRGADGVEVTAVLDWEFALSGTPAFDFGNILRPPLGEQPGFAEALGSGYRAAGGRLPRDWRRIARLADLTAWADFVARPEASDALVADARRAMERAVAGL